MKSRFVEIYKISVKISHQENKELRENKRVFVFLCFSFSVVLNNTSFKD